MTRILALDWGEKRIGIAYSEGIIASPYTVITRTRKKDDYAKIAKFVGQTEAELLIIGLPCTFDSDHPIGHQAKRILKHKRALEHVLSIPIKLVDERFSTIDAKILLRHKGKKRKPAIDAIAAVVILQSFLHN
ncbi:MAG: Holliday junction resolvase RuvX [Anaerolineaceae bacterium 4572_78]|nr:MAG: Holliday junction resolvase RuvX [Anaerolineaceae bacterium 4572_78]